jgi:UDP-2-acetamido-2-deoxy-ribo-hexuluronate aminotransferase
MKFINLDQQYRRLAANIRERTDKVHKHGQYILGPEVTELEQRLAEYVGVKHCIAVANGTDALLIAMMALGVNHGDEVIIPNFTFIAPAEMAALLGAKIIFVDIDSKTYNIDVNLLEQAITPRTKAIIPVSLFGQCADFDAINAIAKKHNISVIEDAAQSFGATYKGKPSCSLSTIACTSFYPSKPLGCYGDGGACFTNDDVLAVKMRCISTHGEDGRYSHKMLGLNSRLDTLQAAVLLAKLEMFPSEIIRRNELANMYSDLLKDYYQVPYIESHNMSVYAQYTIASDDRDKVREYLQKNNIPTAIHYPKTLHQQDVFANMFSSTVLPNSENAAKRVISLPFSAYLNEQDLHKVVEILIQALK